MSLTEDLKGLLGQRSAVQVCFNKRGKLVCYFVLYITDPQWAMAKNMAVSNQTFFITLYLWSRCCGYVPIFRWVQQISVWFHCPEKGKWITKFYMLSIKMCYYANSPEIMSVSVDQLCRNTRYDELGGGYSSMIWVGTSCWDLKSRPVFIPNFAKK